MHRSLVVVGVVLAVALTAAPAGAADNPCVYDDAAKTITYASPTGSAIPLLQRGGTAGEEIFLGTDGNAADLCEDPDSHTHATVTNTDSITIGGTPVPGAVGQNPRFEVSLKNGPFAPGFSNEGDGSSEIEINLPDVTSSFVLKIGRALASETSSASDHLLAGRKGVDLNANEASDDLDLAVGSGTGSLSGLVAYGGAGNDEVSIAGDLPADVVGGPLTGYNSLNGGEGADELSMAGSPDDFAIITGGPGDDVMIGNGDRGFGATVLSYKEARGPITVDLSVTGKQATGGGEGEDTLTGIYSVYGGSGADTISGDGGVNWMGGTLSSFGADGADTIHAGGGDDNLSGGPGADHLFGEGGKDDLSGGADGDDLHGGEESDNLEGDDLFGTPAADTAMGEGGDDEIGLDTGSDTLNGGEGVDEVTGFGATGGLNLDLTSPTTTNPGLGTDNISGFENVAGTTGYADTIKGDEGPNQIYGLGKGDHLEGRGGADTLGASPAAGEKSEQDGGAGDDVIVGGAGLDTISGGPGKDNIGTYGGDDTISAPAEGEKDFVDCGAENDSVTSFDEGLDVLTDCESATPGGGEKPGAEQPGGGSPAGGESPTGGSKPKPLKCRKGFKKVKVKGKARCKKVKRRRHHKH